MQFAGSLEDILVSYCEFLLFTGGFLNSPSIAVPISLQVVSIDAGRGRQNVKGSTDAISIAYSVVGSSVTTAIQNLLDLSRKSTVACRFSASQVYL